MDTWIFPPQSFSDPSRRGSADSSHFSHFSGRACSIARPCHTKYRTMFTMIDTIGARAGHATARAPAIHRVRCVRFSRGPSRTRSRASRPTPGRRRRVTCAAQPPHEDFIPRAARSIHQPASLAAAAAADAQELMSVAGGVLDGGEARRMRFDVASKNLSNDVHGAVRSPTLFSSRSRIARRRRIHRVVQRRSIAPNPHTTHRIRRALTPINPRLPSHPQYGEFPLTGLLKLLEHPAVDEALHAAEHKEGSVDEADKISRAHAFFEDCDPNDEACDLEHTKNAFQPVSVYFYPRTRN